MTNSQRADSSSVDRYLRIGNVDSVPEQFKIELQVECENARIVPDQPPKITITMTNTSSKSQSYVTPYTKVFGSHESIERKPGLMLLVEDYPVELSDSPLRPSGENIAFDAVMKRIDLAPGESESVTMTVWDDSDNDGKPFQPGTYRFECSYKQYARKGENRVAFTWGFELLVKSNSNH